MTLKEQLAMIGQVLQQECVRATGSNYISATNVDAMAFPAPALVNDLSLGGTELNPLVGDLYGNPELTPEQVIQAWDLAAAQLGAKAGSSEISKQLKPLFPMLPFYTPYGHDVRAELVQFLKAASFHGGTLRVTRDSCRLRIGGKLIGFDGQWTDMSTLQRRHPQRLGFRVTELLLRNLPGTKACLSNTGAVFRHLIKVLPTFDRQLNVVFSVATWAGRDCERALIHFFDIERQAEKLSVKTPAVDKALNLVNHSVQKPLSELSELLVPLIGMEQFVDHFGNPRAKPVRYIPQMRERHRSLVTYIQDTLVSRAKVDQGTNQAVLELIQLNDLIRGEHV